MTRMDASKWLDADPPTTPATRAQHAALEADPAWSEALRHAQHYADLGKPCGAQDVCHTCEARMCKVDGHVPFTTWQCLACHTRAEVDADRDEEWWT